MRWLYSKSFRAIVLTLTFATAVLSADSPPAGKQPLLANGLTGDFLADFKKAAGDNLGNLLLASPSPSMGDGAEVAIIRSRGGGATARRPDDAGAIQYPKSRVPYPSLDEITPPIRKDGSTIFPRSQNLLPSPSPSGTTVRNGGTNIRRREQTLSSSPSTADAGIATADRKRGGRGTDSGMTQSSTSGLTLTQKNNISGKGARKKGGVKSPTTSTKKTGAKKGKSSKKCADFNFGTGRQLLLGGGATSPNVLEVARENRSVSLFVDLVNRSGLAQILDCSGPFTVLAPTNNAFRSVDIGLLADLLLPENRDQLQTLLLHHILPGLILADDFGAGAAATLSGDFVQVRVKPLRIDGAKAVTTDIRSRNGVLHLIDSVLMADGTFFDCWSQETR